jgi:hypothetical protein
MMEITDAGKQRVSSLEFALEMRKYLAELHANGTSEELGKGQIISIIAWALVGHDTSRPPQSTEDLLELKNFVNSHVEEINAAATACIEGLAKHDCGDTIH